jgi:hypothetical protein
MHKPAPARACLTLALAFACCAPLARAAETDETPRLEDLADAPPPPDIVRSGEPLEPEVTIIRSEEETIEEYRVGGRLYMVKVTPSKGPSYYMSDMDGDGRLETRSDQLWEPSVPKWVIFSW